MEMVTHTLYEAIFHRKSVRKYASEALDKDILARVLDMAQNAVSPKPEAKVAFRILTADQLEGIVSARAPHYLAVYAPNDQDALISAAFRLQQLDLWLSSENLGSCWLGMPHPSGELKVVDGMTCAVILAFGTPSEAVHRAQASEFKRKQLSEITDIAAEQLLEPVRLAPSATNRQPWFVSGDERHLRLYLRQANPLMKKMLGKMPLMDMGIALCHLWLASLESGRFSGFAKEPGMDGVAPHGCQYIWSVLQN